VYSPPRELLNIIPNAELREMPRNSERSFCCGAGGARMWMEEKIGERINLNRTTEAVETGADQIATGCPFCRVMLSDGLTAKQADGSAREEVEVLDVAQLLLASVKRAPAAVASVAADGGTTDAGATVAGGVTATALLERPGDEATKAEPEPGDATQSENTVSETQQVGANAAAHEVQDPEAEPSTPASGGLFDDDEPTPATPTPAPAKTDTGGLFDDEEDSPSAPKSGAEPAEDPAEETDIPGGADTDPDSADVTEPEIGQAESTAPDKDAAVRNARDDAEGRLF
jgi:hypothetical protein